MERECYKCEKPITSENESDEHIIINAAGGRLKSKDLLCSVCNALFGDSIDSALAKQLNPMANFLVITRHRGEAQPIVAKDLTTGEEFLLDVGGKPRATKPTVIKSTSGKETRFSISARSETELKKILAGVAKKVPGFDMDAALALAKWNNKEFTEPLTFRIEVGGDDVFRAVCKCAVNFYLYKEGDRNQISHLLPYIEGTTNKEIVWMHYQQKMYELQNEECFHLLHLCGKPDQRILYAYVDYFNTFKYLVLLNDNYDGEAIHATYAFDVLENKQVNKQVLIDYDRATLLDFFIHKDENPHAKVQQAFERTTRIGLKRQDEFQRSKLIKDSLDSVLSKLPEGALITEKMYNQIIENLATNWVLREERIRNAKSARNENS